MSSAKTEILIVEDHAVQSMVLRQMIEKQGHTVIDVVDRGQEAINRTLKLKPDLILMDIFLNGDMSGIEAMQQIHLSAPDVQVIYVSGNSDPFYVQKAKQTGCLDFLHKPVSSRDLASAIKKEFENPLGDKTSQPSGIKQIWPINLFS